MRPIVPALFAVIPVLLPFAAWSQETSALQGRLEEIDQRSRIADRKLEILDEEAAKRKAEAAVVTAGEKGFSLSSADKAFVLKIRGVVQADGRFFRDDIALAAKDSFLIRKARPIVEATLGGIADFRVMADFASPTAPVQDAYGDFRPWNWLKLRLGKFKSPVGLERLQSDPVTKFAERALPTALTPNRDIGAQLHGDIAGGAIMYALAVLNGVADGASADTDLNHAKDFAGRLFLQPWKTDPYSPLSGLGFGIAFISGNQKGSAAASGLSSYVSGGQQAFFQYLTDTKDPTNTVFAHKRRTRWSPQLYYYVGPFGLLAEYIVATHEVEKKGETKRLSNKAWLVEASYVLNGDANSYEGVVVQNPFNPANHTWGAVEISLRYNELRLDEDTFPTYANPGVSARRARAVGAAAVWNWSRNLSWSANFEQTRFQGGAAAGDRATENLVLVRGQVAF